MPGPHYIPGDPWAICDRCGFRFRHSQTRKEWTGLRVCHGAGTNDCWESRHPQDFVRGVKDDQKVFDPRPEPADVWSFSVYKREDDSILLRESAGGLPLMREAG